MVASQGKARQGRHWHSPPPPQAKRACVTNEREAGQRGKQGGRKKSISGKAEMSVKRQKILLCIRSQKIVAFFFLSLSDIGCKAGDEIKGKFHLCVSDTSRVRLDFWGPIMVMASLPPSSVTERSFVLFRCCLVNDAG